MLGGHWGEVAGRKGAIREVGKHGTWVAAGVQQMQGPVIAAIQGGRRSVVVHGLLCRDLHACRHAAAM